MDGKNIKKIQVQAKKIPNRNAIEKNSEELRNYQTKWQISQEETQKIIKNLFRKEQAKDFGKY